MKLGDYEIIRPIASGGMGAVFEVEHRETRARYAAKVVKNAGDARARERFRREAELLARVDRHPGIVKVHSFGEAQDGSLYMILDLVRGESLEKKLEREGKLAPHRAAALARSVALALGAAHAEGVVHRDVKPANILVDAASGEPRLTDFGIAAARDMERLTRTGAFVGTLAYAAPEQARGTPGTPASDVYSLGCVLHEMLAGRAPGHGATPMQLLAQLANDAPTPDVRSVRPEVPASLAAIVSRALEKNPARRLQGGAALAQELDRFLAGRAVEAGGRVPRRAKVALAGAGLALGASLLVLASLRAPEPEPADAARARIATLEALARNPASDFMALLAARAAHAIADPASASVAWEADAAGARAALALGASAPALELAGRALAAAPAERQGELRLLHARARLADQGAAAALEELALLASPGALRLRAHLLILEGRWSEIEGLAAEDPFVAAARVLARCHREGSAHGARLEIERLGGDQAAILCALDVILAREAIAVLDSATLGDDIAMVTYITGQPERLRGPCERARQLLADARASPRYVAPRDAIEVVDRALYHFQSAACGIGGVVDRDHALIDAIGRSAFPFARADDPATISIQARVERLIGTWPEHADERRRRFLDESFDRSRGSVATVHGHAVARICEYRCTALALGPEAGLERVEEVLRHLPGSDGTVEAPATRAFVEWLAGELCVKTATRAPAREAELLARAEAHLQACRERTDGTSSTRQPPLVQESACLAVEIALARGEVEHARKEHVLSELMPSRFLAGELCRLHGETEEAERRLAAIVAEVEQHPAEWSSLAVRGDAVLSLRLARLALGRPGARGELTVAWAARGSYPLLPWIDREARKALGK